MLLLPASNRPPTESAADWEEIARSISIYSTPQKYNGTPLPGNRPEFSDGERDASTNA